MFVYFAVNIICAAVNNTIEHKLFVYLI